MVFQTGCLRVLADELQLSFLFHLLVVKSPTGGIADELLPAFLKGKEQAPLAVLCPAGDELGCHERLAVAGGAGYQDDGVAEKPSAAHLVQLLISGSNAEIRRLLLEFHGRKRNYNDAFARYDGKRVLPLLVRAA